MNNDENTIKLTYENGEYVNHNELNRIININKDKQLYIELENTKGLTSDFVYSLPGTTIIRVKGGYTDDLVKYRYNMTFSNGEKGTYYVSSVKYTKNELFLILKEFESLEKQLENKSDGIWSDIQKAYFIYEKLKSSIIYDPNCETSPTKEIRTLRGIVTRKSVCAGFSLIYKELLDRQGIKCEYVEGVTNINDPYSTHAWNILEIDGKKYPIDLTNESALYRNGNPNTFQYFCCNKDKFIENHHPFKLSKTINYKLTLSEIDKEKILQINNQVNTDKTIKMHLFELTRKDGTSFHIAQIGVEKFNNEYYVKYYYEPIKENGERDFPQILIAKANLAKINRLKEFKKDYPEKFYDIFTNVLFSTENISKASKEKTQYIGNINLEGNMLIENIDQITKTQDEKEHFYTKTRRYQRDDKTIFIVQDANAKIHTDEHELSLYDVYELINKNNKKYIKRNKIMTELPFLDDRRPGIKNRLLSRKRLDTAYVRNGGYVGYLDSSNNIVENPKIIKEVIKSKRVELYNKYVPSFDEMRYLIETYDIVKDKSTNETVLLSKDKTQTTKDEVLVLKTLFSYIWLQSAGTKQMEDEDIKGITYAFNDNAREVYQIICNYLEYDIKNKGVIDPSFLLDNISIDSKYKYAEDIIYALFKTDYQTNLINSMFKETYNIKSDRLPQKINMYSFER